MSPWTLAEYTHISKIVGPTSCIFTNMSSKHPALSSCRIHPESVALLDIPHAEIILLDETAPEPLSSSDKNKYLLLGGILGDHDWEAGKDLKDRTSALRELNYSRRNLGNVQMPTDQCVLFAKRVMEDGFTLEEIPYIDEPDIDLGKGEVVNIPMRYYYEGQQLHLADGLIEILMEQNEQGWEL